MKPAIYLNKYINQKSESSYDNFIKPFNIDSLTHILKSKPKNYTTIDLEALSLLIFHNLKQNEPLLQKTSEIFERNFLLSITNSFYYLNLEDLSHGGSGLIIPTFIKILYEFIFLAKDNNLKCLENDFDKRFYSKYFWAYEEMVFLRLETKIEKVS